VLLYSDILDMYSGVYMFKLPLLFTKLVWLSSTQLCLNSYMIKNKQVV